jgi:long-chain acyl-CoA synthetase
MDHRAQISPADTALRSIATLGELFAWRAGRTPHSVAYREYDEASGQWRSHTWSDVQLRVQRWRRAIGALMLGHGARVAILLPNGVDAVCADQAVLSLGLVPVPMHALDNPASIRYILDDCQVALLLTATRRQWRAIADCGAPPAHLRRVVTLEACQEQSAEQPPLVSLDAWLDSRGDRWCTVQQVTGADLAAIVYTSGTTGKPKGVMLSHANVLANLRAVLARMPVGHDDLFLSLLPLSHTFERTIGYYLPMAAGAGVAYARSAALLGEDLLTVRPTILVAVPRVYEKFQAAVHNRAEAAGAVTRLLHGWALAAGWRRFCRRQRLPGAGGVPTTLVDAMVWPVLERLVARAVLAGFGGRLRAAVSGGAPFAPATAQALLAMGLPLLQGYGMTECSPVVAANSVDDNWPSSVGLALEGTEVRLGERDELQVRSASVMLGYWGRPEDTRRAIGADGWLNTGDQAVIEQGRIRIVGRLKDILVTSTGEKIAAADVELAILSDPLFAQVMVIGDDHPYLSAIVVLNAQAWRALAPRLALDPDLSASLAAPATQALLLKRLGDACAALPHYAAPRAVLALTEAWTVENGMLTPTLKLKRNNLTAHYAAQIALMYLPQGSRPLAAAAH